MDAEAQAFFVSLCERKQVLSAVDRDALTAILGEYKALTLLWLPRTIPVRENIALNGENGVFLPLVLDVREWQLHWLDVQAKGQLEMNNVETSKSAIAKICPDLMTYFGSGVRASMFDLALLHAAARCRRVSIRGEGVVHFVRGHGEDMHAFHARLASAMPDVSPSQVPNAGGPPLMALLYRGDVDLPKGSAAYALFRERVTPSIAASDLLS